MGRGPRKKSRLMIPRAMEKVVGNDELLIAILARLPPKSIYRFKSVSKRWNTLLADPYFLKTYSSRTRDVTGRLLAFMQFRLISHGSGPDSHRLMTILPIIQPTEHKIKQFPCSFRRLFHSSQGLILFGDNKFCVANPLTKTWVSLPQPNSPNTLEDLGLFVEDNPQTHIPSFRVVGIANKYDYAKIKAMVIETYSSRTGEWTTSTLVSKEALRKAYFHSPFVHKGVFYWNTGQGHIAFYDSNGNGNCLELINLPPGYLSYECAFTRSPGDDLLWLGTIVKKWVDGSLRSTIKFWFLPKDEDGSYKSTNSITEDNWILMDTIDDDSLCKDMVLLLESRKRKKSSSLDKTIAKAHCDLKLEALIPWNPVHAVLSLRQKTFLYNLESKAVELVRYRGNAFGVRCSWYPYLEPLSLSSYAPLANTYG